MDVREIFLLCRITMPRPYAEERSLVRNMLDVLHEALVDTSEFKETSNIFGVLMDWPTCSVVVMKGLMITLLLHTTGLVHAGVMGPGHLRLSFHDLGPGERELDGDDRGLSESL